MRLAVALLFILLAGAAAAQPLRIENNRLQLNEPVMFKTGTAELDKSAEVSLQQVLLFLQEKAAVTTLRVEGHAVWETAPESQALSEARAAAVVQWLHQHGVDCKRLLAVGFGETKPVVATDALDRSKNSRIEFVVAALRQRPISGLPLDGGGKVVSPTCQ